MHDPEGARFERALHSVTVPPVPLAAIRRTAQSRAASRRTRRNAFIAAGFSAVALCCAVPLRGTPALAAAVVYVQHLLHPADPAQLIVLGSSNGRTPSMQYHRVDTIGDAQQGLSFRVLAPSPSAHWKLATVMVSEGPDSAIALLYRAPHGVWVRITERPTSARSSADDGDVSALLASTQAPQRTISGISLSHSPVLAVVKRTRTAGNVRSVIAATGANASRAISVTLQDATVH